MAGQDANPYEFTDASVVSAEYAQKRPSGITTIGVIALVLGVLGAFGGIAGIAGPMIGKALQQKIITAAEQAPENSELQMQADIQKTTMAVAEKYSTATMIVGAVMLIACIALIVAAAMALRGSATGRSMLVTMCLLILVCDLGKTILTSVQQREMMSGLEGAMTGLVKNDANLKGEEAQKIEDVMGIAMKVGAIFTLVMGIGWFLIKAGFYIYASRYLNRPEVRSYYDARAAGV